jgi:Mg/Co/Ni transporter MgtE
MGGPELAAGPLHARVLAALGTRDFRGLQGLLAGSADAEVARAFAALQPLEKAVCFKLLPRLRALALFPALSFQDRFLMIQAFPLEAVQPVLEDAPEEARALFHRLGPEDLSRLLELAV